MRAGVLWTIIVLVMLALGGRDASATEDEKPFDPYSCWCSGKFLDVSLGHFDGRGNFVVDVPVWNEGVTSEREVGTVLSVGYNPERLEQPHLIFDNSWFRGQWCFQPVSAADPDTVLLRSTVCEATVVEGGTLPHSCEHQVHLSDVVRFSKAALFGGMECRAAAERYLAMGKAEGCSVGRSSHFGLGLSLVLTWLGWRRLGRRRVWKDDAR